MSPKRTGYKYQIEQALLKEGWEIKSIGGDEDWWDDEHWFINHQRNSDISFYLVFIVDPQFEGERKPGRGIYEVKASTSFPQNWNDSTNEIASLSMSKRKFQVKLDEFINDLQQFKEEKMKDNAP